MGETDVAFVGHVDELAMFERLLIDGSNGRPRVALLSGEAGIGKTRFVHEALARARERGFLTLLGACQEDVVIPHLPIAMALRPLADFHADTVTASPTESFWRSTDAHDPLHLYLGVTAAVLHATEERGVVLVIEDVHWADDAFADLLVHLVTSTIHEAADRHLRLLVVLTSRENWSTGGLPGPLGRLGRHPDAVIMRLRPMSQSDVLTFVSSVAGARPTWGLVDELLEATGGNAFLLQSVVTRHLDSGRLAVRGEALVLGPGGRIVAPSDLDDEIRLHLEQVDRATLGVLTEAALVGDDALLEDLIAVHDGESASVNDAVRAAVDHSVLVVDDERYRFAHPQIRHVLVQRPSVRDREQIHRRIAAALITHHRGAAVDHALAIAHHLERGGTPDDPSSAVEWELQAAEQAWTAGAWSRAMHAYDAALHWDQDLDPEERNERQLRSAIAAYMTHDPSSWDRLSAAAALARERGDLHRWTEAALFHSRFVSEDVGARWGQPPKTIELEELLDALGDTEAALRSRVLATMSEAQAVAMKLDAAERYEQLAERALTECDEPDAEAVLRLSLASGNRLFRVLRFDRARAAFERARSVDSAGAEPDLVVAAHTRLGLLDSATGDFARAQRALDRVRSDRVQAVSRERQIATAVSATVAAARGEFDSAERLASEAIALYQLHEYVITPGIAYPVFAAVRALRGDVQGARSAIDAWSDEGARGTWRYRALVEAWTGGPSDVDPRAVERLWRLPAELDMLTVDVPCIHIELARVLDRVDVVEAALAMLEETYERGCRFTIGWPWSIARMVGESWLLLEKADEATRWFSIAERECRRAGARFEAARASLGLAVSAVLYGGSSDAVEHARQAALALDEIGALDLARQARVLCNETAGGRELVRPAMRAILVTDLGDSTALNARIGDDIYVQVLSEHDRTIRRRLAEHSGVEFKHTGDGLCAWFASAGDAVSCALGIRDDLERLAAVQPDVRLAVRTGIAAGEPVDAGDDLFGLAVVVATRVCNLAAPGQVCVAEEVTQLTRGKPLAYREVGSFPLKGLPGTTTIFEALRM